MLICQGLSLKIQRIQGLLSWCGINVKVFLRFKLSALDMRSLTRPKDVSVRWMLAGFVRILLTLAAWNISGASAQGK